MDKHEPIEKLISNKNVIHILSEAKLPGEGDLLVEIVERSIEREVFSIYIAPKNYNLETSDLTFLATVKKEKNGEKIKGWYIKFKGGYS